MSTRPQQRGDVRIGLVGCGRIAGLFHIPVFSRMANCQVVALADPDSACLKRASEQVPQARCFSDYRRMLDEASGIDAVVVCTPPVQHVPVALAALGAGKHVYVEKPLATNLEDAQTIVETWRRARTIGVTGFNFRFHPLYQDLKRHLENGTVGDVLLARSAFIGSARKLPFWKQSRDGGGGVLLDLASHHFDLVPYLFGAEVDEVTALQRTCLTESDNASVQLRLTSGLLVQSLFSMCSVDEQRWEVYGRHGKLTLDRLNSANVEFTPPSMSRARVRRLVRGLRGLDPRWLMRSPGWEPSFARALAAFVHSVQTGRPTGPDLLDGARSLSIVLAAEESAQRGGSVRPYEFGPEVRERDEAAVGGVT